MKGVLIAVCVILAVMALIKDGRILRHTGLAGSCAAVAAPSGQSGYWARCSDGSLEGWPDLGPQSCTTVYRAGGNEYWRCQAPLWGSPGN
jgi:hypothetical protein